MKKRLVVFTGAGISAESGIKTFRDSNGLWENHRVEDVASPEGWRRNKQLVLDFYNQRHMQMLTVEPNAAHKILAELEEHFDVTILTQNVDDLHERAGSTNVLHLHGELAKKRSSLDPELVYPWGEEEIKVGDKCEMGSQIRPHIVWFGESVPMFTECARAAKSADIFVVVGTSLLVYPAASLVDYTWDHIPKFIVDLNPAPLSDIQNLTKIAKKATDGITELKDTLLAEHL